MTSLGNADRRDLSAADPGTCPSAEWDRVIERYARLIHSIPQRFGLAGHDVEDVFQSTFLTAMRREPTPPAQERIVRWLASIACWETRSVLRKRSPEPREPSIVHELRDGAVLPRPVLEEAEELQVLSDALATLRPRERRILEALFLAPEPLSYQAVAQELGVAIGSVGELRRRAIDRLRMELVRRGF